MKATDLLADFFADIEVPHVFGLQGGSVVHIFDSLERRSIPVTYTVHEQAAALAAVAATRVTERPCVCVVTTGPAGTNALTGLLAAWQDSIPTIFVSGQTRVSHMSYGTGVRQIGSQEFPIIDAVRCMTKWAEVVTSADDLEMALFRAYEACLSGRPGPVWIDLPVDVQWASVLRIANPERELANRVEAISQSRPPLDQTDAYELQQLIQSSKRPLIWAGNGVRLSGATELLAEFVRVTGIPFVTTWATKDLKQESDSHCLGTIGQFGQRGANAAVFHADAILVLGSHLSVTQTTPLFGSFAPDAAKAVVDVDQSELDQLSVNAEIKICADVGATLASLLEWARSEQVRFPTSWDAKKYQHMNSLTDRRESMLPTEGGITNSDVFLHDFFRAFRTDHQVVIDGGGTALYSGFQATYGPSTKRVICSTAMSSMGTGIAEGIGACLVNWMPTVVIVGDGSFWMSAMNLITAIDKQIPLIVIVINNDGYLAIRHTQQAFLDSRFYGTAPQWGLSFPEVSALAQALRIPYVKVPGAQEIQSTALAASTSPGPLIIEVMVSSNQEMLFKQAVNRKPDGTLVPQPLADMWPYSGDFGTQVEGTV